MHLQPMEFSKKLAIFARNRIVAKKAHPALSDTYPEATRYTSGFQLIPTSLLSIPSAAVAANRSLSPLHPIIKKQHK